MLLHCLRCYTPSGVLLRCVHCSPTWAIKYLHQLHWFCLPNMRFKVWNLWPKQWMYTPQWEVICVAVSQGSLKKTMPIPRWPANTCSACLAWRLINVINTSNCCFHTLATAIQQQRHGRVAGLLERQKDKKCVMFQVGWLSQYINTDEGTSANFSTKTGVICKTCSEAKV